MKKDYSLLPHNTFRMNVRASYFGEYDSEEQLLELLAYAHDHQLPILHIGQGSNLLFVNDYDGLVLHSRMRGVSYEQDGDDVLVRALSGVVWDDLCEQLADKQLWGTENLSYIPGEVGASAVQNIGAYGVEVGELIERVETRSIQTGESRVFDRSQCHYGYRDSVFKQELKGQYVVTAVTLRLSRTPHPRLDYGQLRTMADSQPSLTPQKIRRAVIDIRKQKLPEVSELGSAGSFFMNPVIESGLYKQLQAQYPQVPGYVLSDHRVKVPAAWLIEQCGWKGFRSGDAGVYAHQPLILVNHGHATGSDIADLSDRICESVFRRFGIHIRPEVNFIGR
ncbi:MAG: UDP-N-acetylmuramate dehydrogenase [Paludibacteraceae bacterium]|nr:UDP-N-acetylmuramate dehydrogenase [Paludibacteraceae bacterium]